MCEGSACIALCPSKLRTVGVYVMAVTDNFLTLSVTTVIKQFSVQNVGMDLFVSVLYTTGGRYWTPLSFC